MRHPGRLTALAFLPLVATVPVSSAGPGSAPTAGAVLHRGLLGRSGADDWHAAGFRGRGVTVAVLDTGFRGWRRSLGGALPAAEHVRAKSFRLDGDLEARDSQHGVLCAEVVHALAPEADLLLADWELGREDRFLAAVRWAKDQGAKVITCSVITPSFSDGLGGGAVHRALAELLGHDILFFASAGNTTERHWGGRFRDGDGGWHRWSDGRDEEALEPWGSDPVAVELYGRPGAVYELRVCDAGTGREVGRAATSPVQRDRLSAAVRFPPEPGHSYRVRVRHVGGPAGQFHLTTTFASLGCTTPGANVCFPGDGAEVVAVGAVDEDGHRQPYSACGTNLPGPKPDLAAVVPVASAIRARPFGGTSAAAPQTAALAVLCLSKHHDWTAAEVRRALEASALDLGVPGPDCETGRGLAHLPVE